MWNKTNKKTFWAAAIVSALLFLAVLIAMTIKSPAANADPHDPNYPNAVAGSDKNDTRPAVTIGEWYSLKAGMTRTEVRKLLDGKGHVADTQKHTEWYRFAGSAPKFMRVIISYDHNKMTNAFLVAKKVNGGTFDVPIVLNGVVHMPETARTDVQDCVTRKEWVALEQGMTRSEVTKLLDGPGLEGEPQVRQWTVCDRYVKEGKDASIYIWFKKQKAYGIYWIAVS